MNIHSRKCASVWSAARNMPPGPSSRDRVDREPLLARSSMPSSIICEHPQQLEVERELLVRGGQAALEPAGGVHHQVASRPASSPTASSSSRPPTRRRARWTSRARRRRGRAGRSGARAGRRRACPAPTPGVPKAGPPVRMSTAVKNEPNRHGAPGPDRLRSAPRRTTPRPPSATSPEAIVIGAVAPASRNGVTTTGWPADAHSLQRVHHQEVPDQRAVGVDDAHHAPASARSPRGRRRRSPPARRRRAPSGRRCRSRRAACPTSAAPSSPCPCGGCARQVGGLDGAALVAGDQVGGVRHLDQLDVVGVACRRGGRARGRSRTASRRPASAPASAAADRHRPLGVAAPQRERVPAPWPASPSRTRDPSARARRRSFWPEPAQHLERRRVADVGADLLEHRHRALVHRLQLLLA